MTFVQEQEKRSNAFFFYKRLQVYELRSQTKNLLSFPFLICLHYQHGVDCQMWPCMPKMSFNSILAVHEENTRDKLVFVQNIKFSVVTAAINCSWLPKNITWIAYLQLLIYKFASQTLQFQKQYFLNKFQARVSFQAYQIELLIQKRDGNAKHAILHTIQLWNATKYNIYKLKF